MAAPPPPALSVLLPVYIAMRYLTVCIRDVLRQEVEGGLELICAWDGGDVDAWEFLVEVAQRCGRVEGVDAPAPPTSSKPSAAKDDVPAWAPSQNPASSAAPRPRARRRTPPSSNFRGPGRGLLLVPPTARSPARTRPQGGRRAGAARGALKPQLRATSPAPRGPWRGPAGS